MTADDRDERKFIAAGEADDGRLKWTQPNRRRRRLRTNLHSEKPTGTTMKRSGRLQGPKRSEESGRFGSILPTFLEQLSSQSSSVERERPPSGNHNVTVLSLSRGPAISMRTSCLHLSFSL